MDTSVAEHLLIGDAVSLAGIPAGQGVLCIIYAVLDGIPYIVYAILDGISRIFNDTAGRIRGAGCVAGASGFTGGGPVAGSSGRRLLLTAASGQKDCQQQGGQ